MDSVIDENRLIEEIWINFNSYYNDASRFSEEETKMADRVWGGVQCMIESQPKVGEWIPCSERLPEEAGFYIVTKRQKSGEIQVALGSYRPLFNEWSGNGNFKDVLAWMPLPEQYKAGDT